MECREAGAPTRVPCTSSTPRKEAEVGLGSGCLTWAKRALGKKVGGEQGPGLALLQLKQTSLLGLSC